MRASSDNRKDYVESRKRLMDIACELSEFLCAKEEINNCHRYLDVLDLAKDLYYERLGVGDNK